MVSPVKFYARLQVGLGSGGIVAPMPNAVHTLSRTADNPTRIFIDSQVRPRGQPDTFTSQKTIDVSSPGWFSSSPSSPEEAKIAELHDILKGLPMEKPSGPEDIYGMETSIVWRSDDLQWANSFDTSRWGCTDGGGGGGGRESLVKPTPEQKEKFKKAIEIVKSLAETD